MSTIDLHLPQGIGRSGIIRATCHGMLEVRVERDLCRMRLPESSP